MERSAAVTAGDRDTGERPGRTERKRRAILQEAETLFLDRGFVGASVEEVAALSGRGVRSTRVDLGEPLPVSPRRCSAGPIAGS